MGSFKNVNPLVFAIATASFMRSLFTAFKNNELCHFVVRIGSLVLISFY